MADYGTMGNGPASTMDMGNNGVISNVGPTVAPSLAGGANVSGPATAKPESKGTTARTISPLTPASQDMATPVGVVDDDSFGNNEFGVSAGSSGTVAPLTGRSQDRGTSVTNGK